MGGMRPVVWKEWRSLNRFPGGRWRLWLTVAMPVTFFALVSPAVAGPEWVEGPYAIAIAVLVPVVVALMVAPDAFAGERERRTLATLLAGPLPDRAILVGKAVVPVAVAWAMSLVTTLAALVAVNVINRGQGLLLPSTTTLVGSVGISLLVAVLAVAVGVLVSLRAASVQEAQQLAAVALMVPATVLGPVLLLVAANDPDRIRRFFTAWSPAAMLLAMAALLVVVDCLVAWRATRVFRRERLVANLPSGG